MKKAYALRERVSTRKVLHRRSHYHDFVTGDMEKTRQACELWTQTYPRDDVPRGRPRCGLVARTIRQTSCGKPGALSLYASAVNYANLADSISI